MRKKHLQQFVIAVALLMPGATAAFGQVAPLSPVPQQISWGSKAFDNTTTYTLQGAEQADSDAVSALRSNLKIGESGKTIVIGEVGDAAVSAYADLVPAKAEGYYLKVSSDQVVIAGHDSVGTFYGVQTFLQIAAQPEVMSCTVTDYPSVAIRGVVEGFYGNPWSQNDRLRQFDFYGANKLNTYIYGPKDDVYHRSQWKVDYPAAQAALLKALVERANHNKVRFVWAIHPGGSIKWTDSDGDGVIDDFVACKKKLESVYKLGVREFAVFFDDIDGEGKNAANQAALMNYLDTTLRAAHPDIKPFILCPTEYNRAYTGGNNTYLTTLGTKMNSSVNIMWTGNSVVDMIDYSDMTWINDKIKRKAYIWLNYPVNDYCINHMLMGPTYGNAKNIASLLSGFTANPMEYAEASKVSLFSIADYTWNMTKYDDKASWKRAINYLWPAQPAAFRIFCQNNIDLGQTAHGLRRAGESPEFASVISAYSATNYSQAVMDSLKSKLDSMLWAAQTLMADTTQPEILNEIKPWLQVMECVAKRGLEITAMSDCLQKSPIDSVGFMNHYLALDSIYSYQKTIRSRNYSGSIKNPNPVVANEVLVPFLKTVQNNLVSQYRKLTDYGSDLLPKLVIPDGRYYIKNDGKYLTATVSKQLPLSFVAKRATDSNKSQQWKFSIDSQTKRLKLVSAGKGWYVNEKGVFGTNDYYSSWNSYAIRERGGKVSIQNQGDGGTDFWNVNAKGVLSIGGVEETDSYMFEVIPVNTTTGIVPLTIIDAAGNGADATGNVYNIKGQMVRKNVKVKDATRNLEKGVYIVNGRKVVVK